MADVHCFTGEKGGVGKSFVCRAAIQYCLDKEIDFVAFDTDRSNPDVRRIYGKEGRCKLAVFSEGEKYEDAANQIYNTALQQRVLVNMPAQVFPALKVWFENNDLLAIAPDDGITFTFWFVIDGGFDSLSLLQKSLQYFKGEVRHIVVKNYGKTDDFEAFSQDAALQALLEQHKATVIDFPKMIGSVERNTLDAASLTFGEALEYGPFTSIARQRVRKFLREAFTAFETAAVLP